VTVTSPIPSHLAHRVLADGLDHVEGICWDPRRRCLWGGGEAGQVYRVELDGGTSIVTTIAGGALLGVALDGAGRLYVCDPGNHQVWRVEVDGHYEPFGGAIDFPNYAAFGADGTLYVSDSGSFEEATGSLFAIGADGATSRLETRRVAYANGLCLDGQTLLVVESSVPAVSALELGGGALERVIEMDRCNPDGLALDAEGGILISCYQPNQLWRWTKSDGLVLVLEDWTGEYVLSPTNIAFFGDDLDQLALASLCGTRLSAISLPQRGSEVFYPELGGAVA
jgi:gluconolactonase